MRDLTWAREDMKVIELKARQRLGAFLLRHERIYPGRCRWTQAHFRWLEKQKFASPVQQVVFQEYVDAVVEARHRVAGLEREIRSAVATWSLRPLVEALISVRGVNVLTAVTVLAELGDITRFDSPRQLMGFLGLVPSEHSSGSRRRQGAITRTGNSHVRRVLVEAAWSYRHPARKTAHLQRKAAAASPRVQALAWAAQKRLCARFRHLFQAGNRAHGETASWSTLWDILSGQIRVTACFRRADGHIVHIRRATRAEPRQRKIYEALGLDSEPGKMRRMAA